MQLCSGQNAFSTVQCCSAKQSYSRQRFTAVTPMETCSSYRCAMTQHQCTAALFRAKCIFHRSVLLCKAGSHQAECHCSYTHGHLLFIQVCSDPAQMQCSSVQGKMHFHCSVLLCKTGSQQAVFHCSYPHGDLLFIQVRSDPAPMQCSSVQGKTQFPLFSTALQNRLTAGSVSLQLHPWRLALHTGVQ